MVIDRGVTPAWIVLIPLAWILVGVGIFFVYSRGRVWETEIEAETRNTPSR